MKDLTPAEARYVLRKMAAEKSLSEFIKQGWNFIDPQPYHHGWHVDAICKHLEAVSRGEIKNLLINVPPRTSKSSITSVGWPAWVWAQRKISPLSGPQVQFMSSSYASTLSERDSTKMRRLITSSWYQENWKDRFKLVGDQNTKRKFENSAGGYRLATSVTGTQTGDGGAILLIDDPQSANDANSDLERQNVIRWWTETMSTRLNDKINGARVVIMQRLHEEDLSGYILEHNDNGEWEHLMLPMRYEPRTHCQTSIGWEDPRLMEDELLCPSRFDEASVLSLERDLGSFTAAGQLQQTPVVKGGGIIKDDWWKIYPPVEWGLEKVEFPPFEFILMSCDTAYTDKQENDYSACTVWGIWRLKDVSKIMLIDAWQERLPFHELVEKIIKTARARSVDKVLIEAKASGLSVFQEIKRLCQGENFSIEAVQPKGDGMRNDKVSRMYPLQPLFENGTIYAPDAKYADMVIQQFSAFPKGKHDDLCFVGDTLIATKRGDIKIQDVVVGDEVVTPDGFKKVLVSKCTEEQEVIERFGLIGTPNHPVFTVDSSYVGLYCASHNLMRLTLCDLIRATLLKLLLSTELPIAEWVVVENITYRNLPQMQEGKILKAYMWQFGNLIRDKQYLKASRLITRTLIHLIMILRTWSAYRAVCIADFLKRTMIQKSKMLTLKELGHSLLNGTSLKKAKSGIVNMLKNLSVKLGRPGMLPAKNVENKLSESILQKSIFAPINAALNSLIKKLIPTQAPVMSNASFVAQSSNQRFAIGPNIVAQNVTKKDLDLKTVYNLTIDSPACYYANGVLVHNCDAATLGLNYMRRAGIAQLAGESRQEIAEERAYRPHTVQINELYGV